MAEVTEYYDRREKDKDKDKDKDEISLMDLYFVLARRKTAIIITVAVAVVVLMCAAYLQLTPKVYKSSIKILPPVQSELTLSNIDDAFLSSLKPKEVFYSVKTELKLRQNWGAFVKMNGQLFKVSSNEADNEEQENPLNFTSDTDFPGEHFIIQYESTDKENNSRILNEFIEYAAKVYVAELLREEQSVISRRIVSLKSDIEIIRQKAKSALSDEVARLESDLAIAKSLGISENQLMTIKNPQALTVVTANLKTPDYMRGVKVLMAELAQLKQRHSNDAYVPDLRDKQVALQRLQSIKFNSENFTPFHLDGSINKPVPVKPNKKKVLALGITLGLMLGIFMVFFIEFFQKARSSHT